MCSGLNEDERHVDLDHASSCVRQVLQIRSRHMRFSFFRPTVACSRHGNHAKGAVIVRPSTRSTLMVSSKNGRLLLAHLLLGSEVGMPSIQKLLLIFSCDTFYLSWFLRAEAEIICQTYERQPEFGLQSWSAPLFLSGVQVFKYMLLPQPSHRASLHRYVGLPHRYPTENIPRWKLVKKKESWDTHSWSSKARFILSFQP
jgi:hypothetical protein